MTSNTGNQASLSEVIERIERSRLHVFITYFAPPAYGLLDIAKDFVSPRLKIDYMKSFARLIKHGKRGHMPWKKDLMTTVRRQADFSRFYYLNNLISSILKMPFAEIRFRIHTNSETKAREIKDIWKMSNVHVVVHSEYSHANYFHNSPWETSDLRNPWYLTWEHKESLLDAVSNCGDEDLFLCLEDDSLFTLDNMIYFLKYVDELKRLNFIPSFLRTEWSYKFDDFVAIDLSQLDRKFQFERLPQIKLNNGQVFVELPNSYSGLILLDPELARQYVTSSAIDEERSRDLIWWDIGARSTMGLQFVNVPPGFSTRHLVLVNQARTGIAPETWIAHQPNIYAQRLEFNRGVSPQNLIL